MESGTEIDATGRSFCLVVSRFNETVTERLLEGARRTLLEAGAAEADVQVVRVPGAWELPWAVRRAADGAYDGIVALGCVIRGETPHFEYVCEGAVQGLMAVASRGRVPVGFGLLTCDTAEQARARAGGRKGDKGEEAARAVLQLCAVGELLP